MKKKSFILSVRKKRVTCSHSWITVDIVNSKNYTYCVYLQKCKFCTELRTIPYEP